MRANNETDAVISDSAVVLGGTRSARNGVGH